MVISPGSLPIQGILGPAVTIMPMRMRKMPIVISIFPIGAKSFMVCFLIALIAFVLGCSRLFNYSTVNTELPTTDVVGSP